jgi:hypothetical protein
MKGFHVKSRKQVQAQTSDYKTVELHRMLNRRFTQKLLTAEYM